MPGRQEPLPATHPRRWVPRHDAPTNHHRRGSHLPQWHVPTPQRSLVGVSTAELAILALALAAMGVAGVLGHRAGQRRQERLTRARRDRHPAPRLAAPGVASTRSRPGAGRAHDRPGRSPSRGCGAAGVPDHPQPPILRSHAATPAVTHPGQKPVRACSQHPAQWNARPRRSVRLSRIEPEGGTDTTNSPRRRTLGAGWPGGAALPRATRRATPRGRQPCIRRWRPRVPGNSPAPTRIAL